jgi:hypothetical protein
MIYLDDSKLQKSEKCGTFGGILQYIIRLREFYKHLISTGP